MLTLLTLATSASDWHVAPSGAQPSCTEKLSIENMNQQVMQIEYAVRGRILDRAVQLDKELLAGATLPFTQTVKCNIGNPQALGQRPLTFARQVLSLLMHPGLLEFASARKPWWRKLFAPPRSVPPLFPADVVTRATEYSGAVPSVGAYSESQGVAVVRRDVAAFIAARDGYAAHADDIFLTDGASDGVKTILSLLLRGPHDAILAPVPQYPLYSATTSLLNGTLAPYYLDESSSWGVHRQELERALERAAAMGATARALVVINPGNPTGQSLPEEVVEGMLRFAAAENLVLMADEVYQENVYGGAKFASFKRALGKLRDAAARGDAAAAETVARTQLVSFHSTSKGFFAECGLRGGYFELQGFDADVVAQMLKLRSISLCSNVVGQFATGLMVRPPEPRGPSHATYAAERSAILASLERRAVRIAETLNALPGISCNPAEGAMYLFPQLALPLRAVAAAAAAGTAADEFYCLRLLEATGLVVVPGSGFRQAEGTHHFRTTFLPGEEALDGVLSKLADFQRSFMLEFSD